MRLSGQQEPLPSGGELSWWAQQDPGRLALYGLLIAAAALLFFGWRYQWHLKVADWWRRARVFLTEVRAEMKKVSYPSRDEVISTTVVVLITSLIFAVYLWVVDLAIVKVYDWTIQGLS